MNPLPALALALIATPAFTEETRPSIYPPAHCAALWEGYADILGDEGERDLAARFRAASVALIGEAETETLISERRPWMRDLLRAYIHDNDDQSRDLFDRLLTECAALAADLP